MNEARHQSQLRTDAAIDFDAFPASKSRVSNALPNNIRLANRLHFLG